MLSNANISVFLIFQYNLLRNICTNFYLVTYKFKLILNEN